MTTVSAKLRERMGDFCATALENVLNYPIGSDLILSVKDRGFHRPAERLATCDRSSATQRRAV